MDIEWGDARKIRLRSLGDSYVRVNDENGRIYFNTESSKKLGENTKYLLYGFVKNENSIVFKPLKEKDSRALPLRQAGRKDSDNKARQVNSVRLANKINNKANTDGTSKFMAEWIPGEDVLKINLDDNVKE